MIVTFHIVKHFWKDGETATWSVSKLFPKDAFRFIKSEYSVLEKQQPPFRQHPGGTIFFTYNVSLDRYGRNITEITAITCGKCISYPEDYQNSLTSQIKSQTNNKLDFTFSIRGQDLAIASSSKTTKVILHLFCKIRNYKLIVIFATIIVFMYGWYHYSISSESKKNDIISMSDKVQHDGLLPSNDNSAKHQSSHSISNDNFELNSIRSEFCGTYGNLDSTPEFIDSNKCMFNYIENQCKKRTKRLSYVFWVKQNEGRECKKAKIENGWYSKNLNKIFGINEYLTLQFLKGKK